MLGTTPEDLAQFLHQEERLDSVKNPVKSVYPIYFSELHFIELMQVQINKYPLYLIQLFPLSTFYLLTCRL